MYNLYSTKVDRLKVNKTIKILKILGSSARQGYIKMLDLEFSPFFVSQLSIKNKYVKTTI